MRLWLILVVCCGLAASSLATQVPIEPSPRDWSWQNGDPENAEQTNASQEDGTEKRAVPESETNVDFFDDGTGEQRTVESVVEEILVSNRQGRNIEGFDQVYADPNVKNALQLGNDTVARSYIRDKLCTLGLMNCENVEGRRPYYSPHRGIHPQDIIYAQPVTIKPVGRPLPAIPVKRPYGPPKPPGGLGFGSPGLTSDVVYGLGGGPPPSISHFPPPSPGYIGSYPGFKKPGPVVSSFAASKPVYELGATPDGFDYDGNDRYIDKKQISLRPTSLVGGDPIQQHVHHHYHHGENGQTTGFVGSPSIGYGSPGTSYDPPGQGIYAGGFQESDDYKKAFKVKAPSNNDGNNGLSGSGGSASANSYAERYPVYEKPPRDFTYGKSDGQKTGKYYGPGNYLSPNTVHAANNEYNPAGSSNTGNNYYYENDNNNNDEFGNDFSSSNYAPDCVCVPYEQCPAAEQAGRKDDLFLPIDPRNLNKNIDAENAGDTAIETIVAGNGTVTGSNAPISSENRARRKREASRDVATNVEERKKTNSEGRLDASDLDSSKLNVKPTWGISFGLPQSNGGGPYPINPYGGNPLVNPYTGYGPGGYQPEQGINLGLVSVNPLLAVQFTKDEYGDKVVKPFVNFHVTPSRHIVQGLGQLLANKKQALYGNYGPGYAPHYHYPPKPNVYYEKPYYTKPIYPSHNPHYHREPSSYTNHAEYTDYYRDVDDYDYDYEDRSFANQYDGRSRSNEPISTDARAASVERPKATGTVPSAVGKVSFPNRRKRDVRYVSETERQFVVGGPRACSPGLVCCRRRQQIAKPRPGQCGVRYTQGINGRIKTPVNVDGDAEFGEYPWQVAILKKDPTESVYVCGGTLISSRHILTAAHCVKTYAARDLRVRLGEWDVNHDVEFYPYIERDVGNVHVHPEFYAGTLYNDIAILRIDHEVDFQKNPHISPACLPEKRDDFAKNRCWTTGWGKDAFGDFGKYQNILKEVDVPVVSNQICEHQMRRTRLGPGFNLHPGFICAGGEDGKDACKGDGGGPMVCERHGRWQLAGIVSWGIGCGQPGVPGVYSRVSHYLDWIHQIVNRY
ncbi:Serine proteinase stubble [Dufourea novaeangliae]|uniref:Phenoloxidase-activating factor 2 n=1 Tax=Dufourea novaeangliae TaxID=178035 RepID=A0A154PJ07_DUFNO|nr:Serine proteinase stubble [Dufourea novaeangliae]